MKKRVCIYIDGANFYGGLISVHKKYTDGKFDFENYIKYLTKKDLVVKIYYYNASLKQELNKEPFRRQQILFSRLRKLKNCEVILCKRKPRIDIEGEEYHIIKGDDVYLTLDMISDAYNNKYDKAILISSDGDFTPLVKRVKSLRKEVCVCYFENCVSNELLNAANEIKLINKKIIKKFFYIKKKKAVFFDADGTLWSHPKSSQNYSDEFLLELIKYLNLNKIDYFVVSGTTKEIINQRLKEYNINFLEDSRIIALADGGAGKGKKIKELISERKFNKVLWVFDKIKDFYQVEELKNVRCVIVKREHNKEDILKAKRIGKIKIADSLGNVLECVKQNI